MTKEKKNNNRKTQFIRTKKNCFINSDEKSPHTSLNGPYQETGPTNAGTSDHHSVCQSLAESEVGITEYLSSSHGFTGIIKSRFSDFHVNEIDVDGNVQYLNNISIPVASSDLMSEEELKSVIDDAKNIINVVNWEFLDQLARTKTSKSSLKVDVTNVTKEMRTKIHNAIRQTYGGNILTVTVGDDNEKFIEFKANTKGNKETRRKKWRYPEENVHFLLHKNNMDTAAITYAFSQALHIKPSVINYCGNKDKRATTTQQCSIKMCEPSSIVQAIARIPYAKVGNFKFSKSPLRLGLLQGNRFRIAIRYIDGNKEEIDAALQHLKSNGFLNYFGMQRFGNNSDVPTWQIGVALLKGNYKLAAELILKPRQNEQTFLREIRETWWRDRNSSEVVAMFRKNYRCIEKQVLQGLSNLGENDYCGALSQVPRNLIMLYPHALQSVIFNFIVSRRIKEVGVNLLVGDLVLIPQTVSNDNNSSPTELIDNEEEIFSLDVNTKRPQNVKMLTEEDIENGTYTIYDVVLPLPGFDVIYPKNDVGTWYAEYLAQYDLTFEDLRCKNKTFKLPGAYRKIISRVEDLSWNFCSFNKADETLIASDVEKLNGENITLSDEGAFRALILNFNLPSSCYATMVLRELLKCDTSKSAQSTLEKCIHEKHQAENLTITESCDMQTLNNDKLQTLVSEEKLPEKRTSSITNSDADVVPCKKTKLST